MNEFKNRGIGVVLLAITIHNGQAYILCNKRGNTTTEFKNKWNLPSGYLDFNEDAIGAVIREVKEECGLSIPRNLIQEIEHSTSPTNNRQNIIFRHLSILPEEYYYKPLKALDSNEVSEIKWLTLREIDNLEFAWNQKNTIYRLLNNINSNTKQVILTFGKFKGYIVNSDFIDKNKDYINWVIRNVELTKSWNIQQLIDEYKLEKVKNIITYNFNYDESRETTGWGGESNYDDSEDTETTGWAGDEY